MVIRLFSTGAKAGREKCRWAFKTPVNTERRPKKTM
jgi:hypothetical protein